MVTVKKRVEIFEAEQYHFDKKPWPQEMFLATPWGHPEAEAIVHATLSEGGSFPADEGDWIVRDKDGDTELFNEEEFAEKFEEVA